MHAPRRGGPAWPPWVGESPIGENPARPGRPPRAAPTSRADRALASPPAWVTMPPGSVLFAFSTPISRSAAFRESHRSPMAEQYIYVMKDLRKVYPPNL